MILLALLLVPGIALLNITQARESEAKNRGVRFTLGMGRWLEL
jgi:hypothetical protein